MQNKIKLFRKQKIYSRFITSIFVILLTSILLLSIFIVFYSKDLINQYHIQSATDKVNQVTSAINVILGEVKKSGRELSQSKGIKNYYDYVRGEYYENLTGEYSDSDLQGIYYYLQAKNDAMAALVNLANSNEYIYDAYIFDWRKDTVITSSYDTVSIGTFFDKEIIESLEGNSSYQLINSDIREMSHTSFPSTEVLTLIYTDEVYFVDGKQRTNGLIINLDTQLLFEQLIKGLTVNPDDLLWIEDDCGRTIMNEKASFTDQEEINISSDDIQGFTGKNTDNNSGYTVVSKTSDIFNWKIVVAIKNEAISQNVSKLIKTIIIVVSIIMLIDLFLALFWGGRLYSPINLLVTAIRRHSRDDIPLDFNKLTDSVINTYEQNRKLEIKLKESLPAYKASIIRGLIFRRNISKTNIKMMFEKISLNISYNQIYVAIFSPLTEAGEDINEEISDYINLRHTIDNVISSEFNCFIIEEYSNRFVVIINASKSNQSILFDILNNLNSIIAAQYSKKCYSGVSNYIEDASELHIAYNEALDSVNYGILSRDDNLVYIEDIISEDNNIVRYPLEKEEALLLCIRNGKVNESKLLFDEIMMTLISSEQSNTEKLRVHMTRILSRLLNIDTKSGNAILSLQEAMSVIEQKNKYEIVEWFRNIIVKMAKNNTALAEDKKEELTKKVKKIVMENPCMDLSLTNLSDLMDLSQSYISRVFKQKTGISYVEYVTNMRIEYSKKLLKQSDMSISEISKKLGYGNSQYYIKIFKSHIGITPGQYKNASK